MSNICNMSIYHTLNKWWESLIPVGVPWLATTMLTLSGPFKPETNFSIAWILITIIGKSLAKIVNCEFWRTGSRRQWGLIWLNLIGVLEGLNLASDVIKKSFALTSKIPAKRSSMGWPLSFLQIKTFPLTSCQRNNHI